MINVNIHQAKTHLSQLLSAIEKNHQPIRICRNGKPVADIVPIVETRDPLKQCLKLKCIQIKYDPTAPLSEDEWPE